MSRKPSPTQSRQTVPWVLTVNNLLPLIWSSASTPASVGNLTVPAPSPVVVAQLAAPIFALRGQEKEGVIEVALSPDELGKVRLRLETDARDPDRIIVHLAFERPETMELFRRNSDQLSEAIRAAGYAEARLDFGQSGTDDAARGDQGRSGRAGSSGPETPAANDVVSSLVATNAHSRPAATAGLDLRI